MWFIVNSFSLFASTKMVHNATYSGTCKTLSDVNLILLYVANTYCKEDL